MKKSIHHAGSYVFVLAKVYEMVMLPMSRFHC